ncbi:MAG: membrane protein insertion efficiency factor YidD [Candidatus Eisenbacteria bacterium]
MTRGAVASVAAYKGFFSLLLPRSCRFVPTCSEYAIGALKKYGLVRGGALALRRLLRCHPFGGSGLDPIP